MDAIKEIDPSIICNVASNGQEVFEKSYHSIPFPHVMFLNINMPLLNGFECLVELNRHKEFSKIPVVIFSTASNQSAIDTAHLLGADLFLSKPSDHKQLSEKLKKIFEILFTDSKPKKKAEMDEFLV